MQNQDFHGDPAELGINPEKLAELVSRAGKEVDEGLLPNAQVAMARQGRLVLFESFGSASNDSLFCIFSSTKAITSAAAWLLMQEGKLDISAPVASLVPEFGGNSSDKNDKRDKSDVIIEQLFTHTAGFPQAPFRPSEWADKKRRMERFASWRLMWPPGSRYEYHPSSSMWVIAEIIERLSGMDFADFVRSRIAEPLGLPDMHLGAPDDVHGRVEDITIVGEPMTPEEYKALGMQVPPETEVTPEAILNFNKPAVRRIPVAGGGGIMSAADLALFYQALLGQLPSAGPLWSEDTMKLVTTPRTGDLLDETTGATAERGLGLMLAGDEKRNLRGFGHTNSPATFGHSGAGGQIAWADPATGISFAWCTSGHDQHAVRQGRRGVSISNRAAVCAD